MDSLIKIIIIGDSCVGKSCLLYSYIYNKPCLYPTCSIGVDCHSKSITINNKQVKLLIWDTVGQEVFQSLTKKYYRDSNIVFLVFAINNKESFINIEKWITIIKNNNKDKIYMVLIGNKSDCNDKRQVSKLDAEIYALEHNIIYLEVTQTKPKEVSDAFHKVVTNYLTLTYDNEFLITPPDTSDNGSSNIIDILSMRGGDKNCCI